MKKLDFETLTKCVTWSKQDYYVREMTQAILRGSDYLMIPDDDYAEAMLCLEERRIQEERLLGTMRRNNEGIELEDNGMEDEAMALYEQNLKVGYPSSHSYERLMIIYRRRKEYEKEVRVIKRAIEVYSAAGIESSVGKYSKRLAKATELLNKQNRG